MSRSYKNSVSQPSRELPPKKFKRQFNKKLRKQTKKILDEVLTEEEAEKLEDLEEIYKGENI